MAAVRGKVVDGGRVVVPARFRKAMGLVPGDTVLFELEGDELRVRAASSALRRIQNKLKAIAPKDRNLSDELIAERRAEAECE
jgi:AbrB family looped-hinge helix DNA binding protein